jgi:hypothetical protein
LVLKSVSEVLHDVAELVEAKGFFVAEEHHPGDVQQPPRPWDVAVPVETVQPSSCPATAKIVGD